LTRNDERGRFALAVCVVAFGAAAFAVAFRGCHALWYRSVFGATDVVSAIAGLPWWLRLGVPAIGGVAAGAISSLRRSPRQGVSNVMEAVVLGNLKLSLRTTVSRVAASWTAIAAGMSIGREGPLIEVGGTLGAAVGRAMDAPLDRTRVLIAAGTAAGFAAAYNTPFAAVLFVLETIIGIAAPAAVIPSIASTVIATAVTRAVVGVGPIYGQRTFAFGSLWELAGFFGLGVVAAFAATAFKRILAFMEQLFERYLPPGSLRAAMGGVVVGMIAIRLPEVAGNGYEPLNAMLDHQLAVTMVAALLIAKVFATSASVGSGVPGGIFTPMLVVGAAVGTMWATVLGKFSPAPEIVAGSYALVGMAATTAASIHAPLTAAVLVFELSGDYAIALPLLLATFVATTISRSLGADSVYEAELKRKGLRLELTLEGRRMTRIE
jgi:chloride channel protein, CIC family